MRIKTANTALAALAGLAITSATAPNAAADTTAGLQAKVDSLESRVQELESGNSGGLIIAPNTTLRFYGYVKADLMFDLDFDLGNTIFGLASLGPASVPGDAFTGHAFQSRFGIETTTQTELGQVMTKVEGDFFGSGGGSFRLRHAYGQLGGLLAGQTWTNFMPIESYPGTLDFQGPAGIPFTRQNQVRYTHKFGNGLAVSASVENDPSAVSDRAAITGAASYSFGNSFVKVAGVSRELNHPSGTESAWGVNVSGHTSLWKGGTLQASYTMGEGIGSYMVFGGPDLDAAGNALDTDGITIGVTQDVAEKFSVGIAYGLRTIDPGVGTPGTATKELETLHLTLQYKPVERVSMGVEYITGDRRQFDGASFSADRIQTSVQFNF